MELPNHINGLMSEHDEERNLFKARYGFWPEQIEPSIQRVIDLRERVYFFWANTMSGTASAA
jgi:hypothetical protein